VAFAVRWLTYAEQQRDAVPIRARRDLVTLLDQLSTEPRERGVYDEDHDQWSATFGDLGMVLYTIDEHWATLTVLRVVWIGD